MLFDDVTKWFTPTTANQNRWSLTTASRMLRNCPEDIRFCYDIRWNAYDKYDPCYAVPRRLLFPINSNGYFICTIPQTG